MYLLGFIFKGLGAISGGAGCPPSTIAALHSLVFRDDRDKGGSRIWAGIMEYRRNLDGYSKAEPFFLVFTHNKTLTLESRVSPKPTRMSHLQIFKASRGESEEEEGRVLGFVLRV